MSKLEREKWSENGVIVTVYEELATGGSLDHHGRIGSSSDQKIRRERKSQPCRHYYDRRADLLAYAHLLRDMASQHLHQDLTFGASIIPKPHPKSKVRRHGDIKVLNQEPDKGSIGLAIPGPANGVNCPRSYNVF